MMALTACIENPPAPKGGIQDILLTNDSIGFSFNYVCEAGLSFVPSFVSY